MSADGSIAGWRTMTPGSTDARPPGHPDYPPRDDMRNRLHLHESAVGSALATHLRVMHNAIAVIEVLVTPARCRSGVVRKHMCE